MYSLGQGYKSEDGSIRRLGELANEVAMQLMEFSVGDFFPSLQWIDVVGGFVARLRSTFWEFDAFNDWVVREHKAAMEVEDVTTPEIADFVDVLLRLRRGCLLDFELTQDHLKAILQVTYSLTLLSYTIFPDRSKLTLKYYRRSIFVEESSNSLFWITSLFWA